LALGYGDRGAPGPDEEAELGDIEGDHGEQEFLAGVE
jgi:hypothetical protein